MQNPALTIPHYALKQVMEFLETLASLVLAIVVFFGSYNCTLTSSMLNGLVIPCKF